MNDQSIRINKGLRFSLSRGQPANGNLVQVRASAEFTHPFNQITWGFVIV